MPELVGDGLPQTLALAELLWMMRAGDDVLDAFADQQLLEAALPAPREVPAAAPPPQRTVAPDSRPGG